MAYGFEVSTSTGSQNTFGLNTGRVIKLLTITTKSGSAYVPEFSSSKGDYFPYQIIGAPRIQPFSWNEGTKTISWDRHTSSISYNSYSSSLQVAFFHYK